MQILTRFNWKRFLLIAIGIDLMLFLAGCTTSWVSEASNIIALLGPAIASALEILSAFGVGLSPTVANSIAAWSQTAQTALSQVATLITQYNTAAAGAQPGILTEIKTLLGVVSSDLDNLLPTLKVTDPATQAKILAVFNAVDLELGSLIALIPALQGKVTDHDEVKALIANLQSAKQFKASFNSKLDAFGPEGKKYHI